MEDKKFEEKDLKIEAKLLFSQEQRRMLTYRLDSDAACFLSKNSVRLETISFVLPLL